MFASLCSVAKFLMIKQGELFDCCLICGFLCCGWWTELTALAPGDWIKKRVKWGRGEAYGLSGQIFDWSVPPKTHVVN
jgi:hypothetical protein